WLTRRAGDTFPPAAFFGMPRATSRHSPAALTLNIYRFPARYGIGRLVAAKHGEVKVFNESLTAAVWGAFSAKMQELEKQHSVFDELGIPEQSDPEPEQMSGGPVAVKRRGKVVPMQVIQFVENQFVQQLTQTNYNVGDVNNAIQSSE